MTCLLLVGAIGSRSKVGRNWQLIQPLLFLSSIYYVICFNLVQPVQGRQEDA